MEQLEATMRCGHCGNIGVCRVKASYGYYVAFSAEPPPVDCCADDEWECEQRMWFLFQCMACSRPILAECVLPDRKKYPPPGELEMPEIFQSDINVTTKEVFPPILFGESSRDNVILYPQKETSGVDWTWTLPFNVQQAYQAALSVQKVNAEAFAIMVGRTLEEICSEKEATGRNLAEKIESLAKSQSIPQVLANMFTQLRMLRNLAAHADKSNAIVKEEDVPIIREFTDAILEYLYLAPMKITRLQSRIHSRKTGEFNWAEGEVL